MLYPITIHHEKEQFVAYAPDLPNLTFTGDNMADVIRNARFVMIEHLQALAEQGKPIPKGNDLSVYLDNPKFLGQTWAVISLDSLKFSQATTHQFPLSERVLGEIYQALGENATLDDVHTFVITAIQEKLAK